MARGGPSAQSAAPRPRPRPSDPRVSRSAQRSNTRGCCPHHERTYAKALDQLRKGNTIAPDELLDDAIASESKRRGQRCASDRRDRPGKAGEIDAAIVHLEVFVSTHVDDQENQLLHRYELPSGYAAFDVDIGQLQATVGAFGEEPRTTCSQPPTRTPDGSRKPLG